MPSPHTVTTIIVFVLASGAVLVAMQLLFRGQSHKDDRLTKITEGKTIRSTATQRSSFKENTLPKLGGALLPSNEEEQTRLRTDLYRAGMYGPNSMKIFLGIKLLLIVTPAVAGGLLGLLGIAPMRPAITIGAISGILGIIGPSFYLTHRTANRHKMLRRGLPDALDLIVICLEAGLTLEAAIRRVRDNLRTAHKDLTTELTLVQHDTEIGRSSGEALQNFATRTNLDQVKALANVVTQAERFGASIVKSLRVHAQELRDARRRAAEQKAQKAGTWILIPTILFIFPGIFVVILGPAAVMVYRTMVDR